MEHRTHDTTRPNRAVAPYPDSSVAATTAATAAATAAAIATASAIPTTIVSVTGPAWVKGHPHRVFMGAFPHGRLSRGRISEHALTDLAEKGECATSLHWRQLSPGGRHETSGGGGQITWLMATTSYSK